MNARPKILNDVVALVFSTIKVANGETITALNPYTAVAIPPTNPLL